MDGKNRAASSYLSPGNPPADKEQNDPLAQVFHNACSEPPRVSWRVFYL